MKSRVTQITPVLTQQGQLKTWDGNFGLMYYTTIVFENGSQGEYQHKPNPQTFFKINEEAEFTHTPNVNPQYAAKIAPIRPDKGGSSTGGGNQSLKGYALRYAVDVWIQKIASGEKCTKEQALQLADYFLKYMEDKPAPVAQTVTTAPVSNQAISQPAQVDFVPEVVEAENSPLPF